MYQTNEANMWEFIQDQMLGMKWLSSLIGRLLTAVRLDVNTRIGGSVQFFLYDVDGTADAHFRT